MLDVTVVLYEVPAVVTSAVMYLPDELDKIELLV